jgi:hypothetical protein
MSIKYDDQNARLSLIDSVIEYAVAEYNLIKEKVEHWIDGDLVETETFYK